MDMKNYILVICMFLLITGCGESSVENQNIVEKDGLICENMGLWWIEEFSDKYKVGVKDAIECKTDIASAIIMQLETCNKCGYGVVGAEDLAEVILHNQYGVLKNKNVKIQDKVSSGGAWLYAISSKGKTYGTYGDLRNQLYLIVIESEDTKVIAEQWDVLRQDTYIGDDLLGPVN
tara:strand:+ start:1540 stop:2067 length:528 start_codon:yes stop_codon:yes gene_type:complete